MKFNKGTHGVQHVDIMKKTERVQQENNSEISDIEVSCHYGETTENSVRVLGCFMVVLGLDSNITPVYRAVYRESNAHKNSTFILRENSIRYANFYDIELNQFPRKYPAQTKMMDMITSGGIMNVFFNRTQHFFSYCTMHNILYDIVVFFCFCFFTRDQLTKQNKKCHKKPT